MDTQKLPQLPIELVNHILTFRPIHPVAMIMKDLHQEFYYYKLPPSQSVWRRDEHGKLQHYFRVVPSSNPNKYKPYLFTEWCLYLLPNVEATTPNVLSSNITYSQ